MPSITDSIGRVLGDRYRLVTALGTGASAHVYLAEDVSLHRRVAIKVLHPALAGDTAFLKRFRAEAQAVAALNHPNILQVYDWGEEDGVPYLVLEFLAGGSLRQVYDTGALLSPEQAVQVGIEAAAGLDYAHRRGLVHRDIKPANLLFDADGRLRIADFGLARALAEASWTEPEGAILGTARYSAPEQVEGWVLDGKADVYALALVLYEGVTGEAAFIGDTTLSTLMARVGVLLPEHEALGPLNDILVWAAAPEPSERYDAAQLGVELKELAASLPRPEPLAIVEGAPLEELGAGRVRRLPRGADERDLTELGVPDPGAVPAKSTRRLPTSKGAAAIRRRRRWPWITAAVAVVVALIAAAALASASGVFTPSHPVPRLVGKTLAQADQAVRSDHFVVRVTGHATSTTVRSGLIISQSPRPGTKAKPANLKQGSTIGAVVSIGPPPVTIPSLAHVNGCAEAIQVLLAVKLVGECPTSVEEYSSTLGVGAIVKTVPGITAPYGSKVVVVLSKGHAPVLVPTLTGPESNYPAAAILLTRAGFVPSEVQEYSDELPAGRVIGTTPPASAVPQPFGSNVAVAVSIGPRPVIIPDEVGKSVKAAKSTLEGLGLVVAGPYGPPRILRGVPDRPGPGGLGPAGHHRDPLLAVPQVSSPRPGCELCEAARITEWFHEDDVCWVAACEVCDVPMVVWKHHGDQPPDADVQHMLDQLGLVADAQLGAGVWSFDRVMRQIPDHFHAHARDPNWWFRRFGRR